MKADRARWPIATMARPLQVSPSGYYACLVRRHFSAEAAKVLWVADATYIPTGDPRRLPSGGGAAKRACSPQWGRPAADTTTRYASRPSVRSKRNCSIANTSAPTNVPGDESSGTWQAGTTCAACAAGLRYRSPLEFEQSHAQTQP